MRAVFLVSLAVATPARAGRYGDCDQRYPVKPHMSQAYAMASIKCKLDQVDKNIAEAKVKYPVDTGYHSTPEEDYANALDTAMFNAKQDAEEAVSAANRPYAGLEPYNPGTEYYEARYGHRKK
jgi:hypothetical protein